MTRFEDFYGIPEGVKAMSRVPTIHPTSDVNSRCFLSGALSAKCAMTGAENKEHNPCAVSIAVVTVWV
jgi:hypothetical protein